MGNLRETGEIRNHRQVAITTVQLHFLDDVVITTMVEICGDETLQIALCLDAGEMFGPGGEGFMRLNVATPRSILKQAVQQLEKAVTQL